MTIDDLAHRSGMTVRNVRAYQSRGLLPPPDLDGRTGYYDREHLARLEIVKDLQAEGFNLEGIKKLIERTDGRAAEARDFTRSLLEGFSDERPRVIPAAEYTERWGDQLTPEIAAKARELGIVRFLEGDQVEMPSPRLNDAAKELADLGIPLARATEIAAMLREHSDAIAGEFIELFLEYVWNPFVESGEPEEEWPRVREGLERLRPLASDALLAMFQLAMTERVEKKLAEELRRLGEN